MIIIEVTNPSLLGFEDSLPRKKLIPWTINLLINPASGEGHIPKESTTVILLNVYSVFTCSGFYISAASSQPSSENVIFRAGSGYCRDS